MTLEDYRKLLDDVRKAQGALNHEVTKDLQRLASAESNNTKAKIAEAYENGLKEAWELAAKIWNWFGPSSTGKLNECFGTNFIKTVYELDVKEALQKYREYMQKQKEEEEEKQFHVGDEVENNGTKLVVIRIVSDYSFHGIDKNGETYNGRTTRFWKKTGRHFGQIENILEEMKGQDAKN